ncbi:MEDS domain-containing protein [Halovivax sp.]|uniref:MEDS domain-containing protein n=1 Tax=Halovivax sp. TaxID=1935978 RepID=UPI0025BAE4D0|nr:MEDS domain-containing protein [Halovivax sp.]
MSKQQSNEDTTFGLDGALTGVETRRKATAICDHHGEDGSNDHLASVYDNQDDQFAAVVPFIKEGLEQGEQCLYVADDNTVEEVLGAFREGGIDVETARESGALSIHTKADTYLRTSEFEPEQMLEFWEETLAEARDREGYDGVRAAAEMTWALDEDTGLDQLIRYEALLNTIYEGDDYVVLCQYNRDRFSTDVLSDVIRSHPLVVYDGTVCQNFYYHPPDEFFGTDHPPLDVDRTVEGLVRHAETRRELTERDRFQSRLYEITSDPDRSFDEKLQALFELGCERFDLDLGGMARIDPQVDIFEVEYVSDTHDHLQPGTNVSLSETYCRVVTDDATPIGITAPADEGFEGTTAYEEFGVKSYLGTRLRVENGLDRSFFFVAHNSRETSFSDAERTFLKSMAQWVQQELERREYEHRLEESNERLEQFAYAASHDLQEPLRMVSSYLQLLERRYGDDLDTDAEEFIEFAVDGAVRMREMIDGLLEYSRIETDGDPFEPVDLEALTDDVLTDLQLRIEETDADVTVEPLPHVEGDGNQLRMLFQNLINNAIEYSGDEPPRVSVSAGRAGNMWRISVRDDGIGVPRDDQERIFEVFERLHARDEHGGTGIGLALCERIVERHGGTIWVDSEPGEGSTFSFTLPPVDT